MKEVRSKDLILSLLTLRKGQIIVYFYETINLL